MDLRLLLAIVVGKSAVFILKLTGSGATAAPGLYALKIDPDLIKKLSKKIKNGSIIISGTNGKTTTSRLTYDILSQKYKTIHNRQGSNLLRGIASTLISQTSVFGKINFDLAIWEADEATLPQAISSTYPKTIVLLNLFRDQLDRYGEIDTIRSKWQNALSKLPSSTNLILNADDPGISTLKNSFKGQTIAFGVEDSKINLPSVLNIKDIKHCLNCNSQLNFSTVFSAHMGHYSCSKCKSKRPKPQIFAKNLSFKKNFTTTLQLTINHKLLTINYNFPGLYNVYNILAASGASYIENTDPKIIKQKIEDYSTAFGRFQEIKMGDKNIVVFLIKNPTGANEVIRVLTLQDKINMLVILNDKIADGKDVSWIWDTNWEVLKTKINKVTVCGIRAWDLATRFKYAEIKLSKNNVYKQINYSIKKSLEDLNNKDTLIILPTYTALLEVQRALSKLTQTIKWQKQ